MMMSGQQPSTQLLIGPRQLRARHSSLPERLACGARVGLAALLFMGVCQGSAAAVEAPGPRGPVGPDVPLTTQEQTAFAKRVTVSGFTGVAIQAAIDQAVKTGVPVVYLPAGTYVVDGAVLVSGGLTILGAGSQTVVKAASHFSEIFFLKGDRVRFTRMKLQGLATDRSYQSSEDESHGISNSDHQNIRIDHNDISGFAYATTTIFETASTQIDHCYIHHNQVVGLGYGALVSRGGYLLAMDNVFGDSRFNLAANSNANKPSIVLKRETHFEFIHNKTYDLDNAGDFYHWKHGVVGTKGGFHGTFIIEGNHIERVGNEGLELGGGNGLVQDNEFANVWEAIQVKGTADNGVNGMPHDIRISHSIFGANVGYQYDPVPLVGINIWVDGAIVPTTAKPSLPPPTAITRLVPMGDDGILGVTTEPWPRGGNPPPPPSPAPTNQPPSVNAGADQTLTLPSTASLSGTATDDGLPTGSSLTTTWSKVSGPGTVTFTNPAAKTTTASFSVEGSYILRLTASDGSLTSSDDVTVTVNPVAAAPPPSPGTDGGLLAYWPLDEGSGTTAADVTGHGHAGAMANGPQWTTGRFGPAVLFDGVDDELGMASSAALTSTTAFTISVWIRNDAAVRAGEATHYIIASKGWAPSAGGGWTLDWISRSAGLFFYARDAKNASYNYAIAKYDDTKRGQWHHVAAVFNSGALSLHVDGALASQPTNLGTSTTFINAAQIRLGGVEYYTRSHLPSWKGALDDFRIYSTALSATDIQALYQAGAAAFDFSLNASGVPSVQQGASTSITLAATLNPSAFPGLMKPVTVSVSGLPSGVTANFTPASCTPTCSVAMTLSATASAMAGQYPVIVKADGGNTAKSLAMTITVVAAPINTPPVVNAGTDQTITLPATATLIGTATDDGLPNPPAKLTTTWSKISGPDAVTFADASALATTASFATAGSYVLRWTASDDALSASDDVTVTVQPAPAAGPLVVEAERGALTKPMVLGNDGSAVGGQYVVSNTENAGTATFSLQIPTAGQYVIWTRVRTPTGGNSFFVTVDGGGEDIFDLPITDAWTFLPVNGRGGTGKKYTLKPRLFNLSQGAHALTFRGREVNSQLDELILTTDRSYVPPNPTTPPPVNAQLTVSATTVSTGAPLEVSVSNGPGNPGDWVGLYVPGAADTAFLTWQYLNGSQTSPSTGVSAAILHFKAPATAGNYEFRLYANDDYTRLTTSPLITVTAVTPPNQPPTVQAGADQALTLPTSATLSGTVSDDGLPTGSTVTVTWSKVSGPGPVTFANAAATTTTATFSTAGSYVLRLTASDGALSASDDLTINLLAPTPTPVPTPTPPPTTPPSGSFIAPAGELVLANDCPPGGCNDGNVQYLSPVYSDKDEKVFFARWKQIPHDNTNCEVVADSYDYRTGTASSSTITKRLGCYGNNGHDAPSIVQDSDGFLVVYYGKIYCAKNGGIENTTTTNRGVCSKRSLKPGSITDGWGLEEVAPMSGNYVAPSGSRNGGAGVIHTSDGTSHLMTESNGGNLGYAQRTASGTWLPSVVLVHSRNGNIIDGPSDHFSMAVRGQEIHVDFAASNSSSDGHGLWYIESTDGGKTFKDKTGNNAFAASEGLWPLGSAPTDYSSAYAVKPTTKTTNELPLDLLKDGTPILLESDGAALRLHTLVNRGTPAAAWQVTYTFPGAKSQSYATPMVPVLKVLPSGKVFVFYCDGDNGNADWHHLACFQGMSTDQGHHFTLTQLTWPGTYDFRDNVSAAVAAPLGQAERVILKYQKCFNVTNASDPVTHTGSCEMVMWDRPMTADVSTNQPPTVDAGPDQTIALPASANLTGTATDDGLPSGSSLTTTWTKVSGPGTVTFANANAKSTTASFSLAGSYVLRLTASDGSLSASDDLTVTVNPMASPPPTVTPTITITSPSVTVGATLQVTVANGPGNPKDWVGLYAPGSADNTFLDWQYLTTGSQVTPTAGITNATRSFKAPNTAGSYEARFYANDLFHKLASSSVITVTGTAPPPPSSPPASEPFGPRGPVGPDVPLTAAEQTAFAKRVTVSGFTGVAIQAAIDQAVKTGVPVVFLPAGTYRFETTVNVPGGLTLLGAGSSTLIQSTLNDYSYLFDVQGDHVRVTRLKLQGLDTTWSTTNDSRGINSAFGKQNLRIDHCELLGFDRAINVDEKNDTASAQVDHCVIHHNLRAGYGYGVAAEAGAYVLVIDNEFSQCRHPMVSGGDDLAAGARVTHWEFRHNRVNGDDLVVTDAAAVNTHGGLFGTFVVQDNVLENLQEAMEFFDGSGLVTANVMRNISRYPAILVAAYDTPVPGAAANDISITGNTFQNVATSYEVDPSWTAKPSINIWIDGKVVPSTAQAGAASPPPPMPYLILMGDDGILRWQ